MIAVYVPTLRRPSRLQPLVDNIRAASTVETNIVFVTEPGDTESHEAALATGCWALRNKFPEASYSNALQTAYESPVGRQPYFIGANDDFDFQPGWDTAALDLIDKHEGFIKVVGINDGNDGCVYTTISLVMRSYIETQSGVIDMPNRVNYPYKHNYVDTEFAATAKKRCVFAPCPESVIIHRHPDWGYGDLDPVYLKNKDSSSADGATFSERARLWA